MVAKIAIYFVRTLRDDIFDATLGGSLRYPLMDILAVDMSHVIIRPQSRLWNRSENVWQSWSLCPSSSQTDEASWAYLVRRDIVKRGRRETIDQRRSSTASALSEGHRHDAYLGALSGA